MLYTYYTIVCEMLTRKIKNIIKSLHITVVVHSRVKQLPQY